jgi:hypothetical protein
LQGGSQVKGLRLGHARNDQLMPGYPLVAIRSFIEATRDSGYKGTSSAIAELVDNSFEAEATVVELLLGEDEHGEKRLSVTDNGTGMHASTMQLALQFGGSTRFNSRRGTGRYGMGLPNGSLSQARRVDVYSWTNPHNIWSSYLDVDEIASGALDGVPPPVRFRPGRSEEYPSSASGTTVILTKCDRLDYRTIRAQVKRLHADMGRIFRQQLYSGKLLRINGELVNPIDPLFFRAGNNLVGAVPYGPPLTYEVSPAGTEGLRAQIAVTFAVLPVEKWHSLSNEEKNRFGISKGAGVSVIRAGREIDYGWYFMGSKRKENYDDWWRLGAGLHLDIDPGELSSGFRLLPPRDNEKGQAELYLFDTSSGGAGYAAEAGAELPTVLERTAQLLLSCPAGCERSCHNCLRHYGNRFLHPQLDRRLAALCLEYARFGTMPTMKSLYVANAKVCGASLPRHACCGTMRVAGGNVKG